MSLRSGIIIAPLLLIASVTVSPDSDHRQGLSAGSNAAAGTIAPPGNDLKGTSEDAVGISVDPSREARLRELTDSLSAYIEGKLGEADPSLLATGIETIISAGEIRDTLLLSDALYFAGIHFYQAASFGKAYDLFSLSSRYREMLSISDKRYSSGLMNMATALHRAGDFQGSYSHGVKALAVRRSISGNDSSALANNYLNLASSCLELNDHGKAVDLAEAGLGIARIYPDAVLPKVKADLYHVIGLSLYRTQEYNKSLVYCREALKIYEKDPLASVDSRILMYNNIAQVYRRLGQPASAEEHFRRGLAIRDGPNTQDKFLLYINYSGFLAQQGKVSEGERVLEAGLDNVRSVYGDESREYYMMLASVAEFVNSNLGDRERSIELYDRCFSYVRSNPWDVSMMKFFASNYVEALLDAGRYHEVLKVTAEADSLSYPTVTVSEGRTETGGSLAAAGGISEDELNLLEARYRALNSMAAGDGGSDYLRLAVATGRELAMLYDRQRLEMSEEESRTSLSSYSRDLYTGLVGNYAILHESDNGRESLEGLFEFSERSKVAGFLASMRELNAARFSLPEELTRLDAEIRGQTGFYRELMAREQMKKNPDSQLMIKWESAIFRLLRARDSLNRVFEEQYPLFYNLKFRNEVIPLSGVGRVIGRRANLLSYVLTDDRLYIFVAGRRRSEVITRDIDSTFFEDLQRFRGMLTTMPRTSGSRVPFNEYMDLAYSLYRILIEPAEPYLSGDKIVVSPDNILSYLPFETLVTEEFRSPDLLYREAPFALKKYRFSYIYSVTLSSESEKRTRRLNNDLIAFAPTYEGVELDDTLLIGWPSLRGEIRELPYALLEAEDAVSQCGGRAFLGEEAREDTFKSEAPGFDIIHLAMHTLLDDRHPAYSKMLFTNGTEGSNDGLLNTYEVYSIPLNAMMVVLSSCNTGAGMLVNGEGILSLARGFLYAGSRSAIMSMWEVEDISASEVIHSFYKNMRGGQTKSSALRNARLKYLRTASQGKSHPYYWSALVIYGDDTPLWYNRVIIYVALLLLLLVTTALVAIVYRGPRS
ncbi:MAG: CHAT domain-containing protein [Bacteroidales bacterium]|nr:CHAT domain-containing protein [Bacteroidales bacterium]